METKFSIGEKVFSVLTLEPFIVIAIVLYENKSVSYLVMDQERKQNIVPEAYLISEFESDLLEDTED